MSECVYYKAVCRRFPSMISAQNLKIGSYVYDFSPQRYAWCEVGFVQKGRIREYRGEREWCHEPGCIYTFAAPAPLRHYSEETDHVEIILRMRIQEWQPVTREEILHWSPKPGEFLLANQITDPILCRTLEPLIKQAVEIFNSRSPLREQKTIALLLDILSRISEHVIREVSAGVADVPPRDNEYCRRACAYIAQQLPRKLTTEEVARHAGISYSRLSRIFREAIGMTLVEYIHRQRLLLTEQYILEHGLRQEDAALQAGFCSSKYMQRLFRRYNGVTFTEYQNSQAALEEYE